MGLDAVPVGVPRDFETVRDATSQLSRKGSEDAKRTLSAEKVPI